MAKHTCAICGAEVNLMSGQKLADGNYICRKNCGKKCFKVFLIRIRKPEKICMLGNCVIKAA